MLGKGLVLQSPLPGTAAGSQGNLGSAKHQNEQIRVEIGVEMRVEMTPGAFPALPGVAQLSAAVAVPDLGAPHTPVLLPGAR